MDKVRCGVIGVGGMGQAHCQFLQKVPETELTAVCDQNPEIAAQVAARFGVPSFTSYIELLESGLADMVIIATPHPEHPSMAIEAFKRGLHVLSEKPIAVTVAGADAMIAAARESGKKFGVMFQMRTEPLFQTAKQLILQGRVGEVYRILLIISWYRNQAYYDSSAWRATWSGEGGGVLINQAPHLLDLLIWLCGLPARVLGQSRTRLHEIEVEDEAFAFLEYAHGAHGYLYASTIEAPSETLLEICGDRGKLLMTESELRLWEVKGSIREFTFSETEMWAVPPVQPVGVSIPQPPAGALRQHAAIIQNFARAILYDEPLIAPGEEGLNVIELINAVILSAKRNKPVEIPVNRAEYEALLGELIATSRPKRRVREQRVTDPRYR